MAKLLPSDGAADDTFGSSVSISGDTAIIGAVLDNDNGTESGSAYMFTRSGDIWSQQAKLLPTDGAASDYFGDCVSINGDTAVIGAPGGFGSGVQPGAAYLFTVPLPCPGDIANELGELNPDGMVSFGDFLALLGLVGPCP